MQQPERSRVDKGASLRAALFDLDGTLADTLEDIAAAVNSSLAAAGFAGHPAESYKLMVGNGFELLMRRALPPSASLPQDRFEALYLDVTSRYAAASTVRTKPYDGIPAMLSALVDAGITLAVLSNKPDAMVRTMVAALFPGVPFIEVHGERPGVPKKPDPAAALEIARHAGIPAAQWFYLGDSGVDMRTAAAAGMLACGALWGFRTAEELSEAGASMLAADPSDVLAVFGIRG
ncbi:MAG: HAD family hydrolase [Rectinemataceae bacterium]